MDGGYGAPGKTIMHTGHESISSTFYAQVLHALIPKMQKKTDGLTVFFALLGSACIKAACW